MILEKIPEVYAGFGTQSDVLSELNGVSSERDLKNVLSGPNWVPTLTKNVAGLDGKGKELDKWYSLNLLGKYHTKSMFKQFHALTFYFQNTTKGMQGRIITAMLPESFTYSIGGKYGTPIKLGTSNMVTAFLSEMSNGNLSSVFGFDTAQVWNSPNQMDIVFKIPVIDDSGTSTNTNYQEAIDLFGEAILPSLDQSGQYESTPGPSILTALSYKATHGKHTRASATFAAARDFAANIAQDRLFGGELKLWDRISVQVGGILLLDWCIIKDLKVTFPNTKAMVLHDFRRRNKDKTPTLSDEGTTQSLHEGFSYKSHLQPIQAELEVTVSTVMGLTRATFKDMLYQNTSIKDSELTATDKIVGAKDGAKLANRWFDKNKIY